MTTHKLKSMRGPVGAGLVLGILLAVTPLAAQTTTNPRSIEFTASPDHNQTLPDGRAAVNRYDLRFYNQGASQPFQTNSLGKPTPNASGLIRMDLAATLSAWPLGTGITYEARVSAAGPGGVGESAASNAFTFVAPCGYALSTTNVAMAASSGAGTITVSTAAGCSWTASSNAAWIAITAGSSVAGVGLAQFSVSANPAVSPRIGTITVAGQTVTVTQAGASCTFRLSSTAVSLGWMAGNSSIAVTAPTGCAWTATSDTAWIAMGGVTSGTGNGSITVSVSANPSATPRSGMASVAGQPVTVTQRGAVPLSVTSLRANVTFPSRAGTPITWTATAAGGTEPYSYRFWVSDGRTWTVGRGWSTSRTWTWEPPLPGTYTVQVWARNAGSGAVYDAWRQATALISKPRVLTVTTVVPSRASAAAGEPVTWTATATGGRAPYTYQFWVFDGASWRVGQNWSRSASWVWTPPTPGTYTFQVWVRKAGSSARLDALRSFGPYTATRPPVLTATALTADRAAPTPAGTPVVWTAVASGGTGPYTYQFWVWNGLAWTVGQDWSTSPTWTWIPREPGAYSVQVWIRNGGSVARYDAWRGAAYTISDATALMVTGFVADRDFPVPQGTPVTWTASAVGGTGPFTYKFFVYDGVAWSVGRDWSSKATWTWVPTTEGTYSFQVWVRNAGSSANFDAWRGAGPASVSQAAPLAVTALTISPLAPLVTGGPAVVTSSASGGNGPYTYQFWVFDGTNWSIGRSWSSSRTFTWTPPAPGTYVVQVWVRNAGSAGSWDAWRQLASLDVIP